MSNDSNSSVCSPSAPIWQNWSGNLVYSPAPYDVSYYYTPTKLEELKSALDAAKAKGATVRVSGQRHSQAPLVVDDNRGKEVPQTRETFLVDMSCYRDLGSNQDQHILLGPGVNKVTVNTGVRGDELDAFLTKNNLLLKTATAGGFFSLGGMTAVDVHGATVNEKIFAETVSAFTILLADGSVKTINAQSPTWKSADAKDWSPLQFVRVSLGGLGIVTSVTIDVLPRPYATTLRGGYETHVIKNRSDFVSKFQMLLTSHDRVEAFFTPYANAPSIAWMNNPAFLVLYWDVDSHPTQQTQNQPPQLYLANARKPEYGAPNLFGATAAALMAKISTAAQSFNNWLPAGVILGLVAFAVIKAQAKKANKSHSELWLTEPVRCIFMSYFIPLPELNSAGLGRVWDGMDLVARKVTENRNFHIAAPMEFRIVKGGDSAMSGAYSENSHTWFVKLELIGWVDAYDNQKASDYPPKLLKFFADVEREWVKMGGFPHHGKMYGFYDPAAAPDTHYETGPFNPNFLKDLGERRGARLKAFNAYRKSLDPSGLFYNSFLRSLLEL